MFNTGAWRRLLDWMPGRRRPRWRNHHHGDGLPFEMRNAG
jgi:hypothetical protein